MARAARHGEARAWVEAAAQYAGDDCLLWPFRVHSSGYGTINLGKPVRASRYVCILAHGEPSGERNHSAHSCGNSLCCNPRHIRWATNDENQADKEAHGTVNRGERNGAATLTADTVRAIRAARASGAKRADLARRFNVHSNTIYAIATRKRWAWLKGGDA